MAGEADIEVGVAPLHVSTSARVRPATAADIPATIRLHAAHLNHGFLVRLGLTFLRTWHRAVLASPHSVVLVACSSSGQVVGFLMGSTDHRALMTGLLTQQRRRLVVAGVVGLLQHPALAVEFARTRCRAYRARLRRETTATAPPTPISPVAVVTAVVVAPLHRREGVGTALMHAFTSAATQAGTRQAVLITQDGARGAAAFYSALGWTFTGIHHDLSGHPMSEFTTPLHRRRTHAAP